jgi:transposase, IS5 family
MFHRGFKLDPCLQAISDFLDDNASIIDTLRGDLRRGLKNPNTGRPGLTPEQVLRSLILKRMKNWNYRELRDRIDDGFSLRKFTEFYAQPVPEYHAFNHAFNR